MTSSGSSGWFCANDTVPVLVALRVGVATSAQNVTESEWEKVLPAKEPCAQMSRSSGPMSA
jgi:hypothetical protein